MKTNNEKERNDLQDKNLVKLEMNIERLEFALKKVDGDSNESSGVEDLAGDMVGKMFQSAFNDPEKSEDGKKKNHKVESFNRDLE